MKKIYKFLICAVVIFSLTALPSFAEVVEDNRYNYVYTVTQSQTITVGDGTEFYFELEPSPYVSHHVFEYELDHLLSAYGDVLYIGGGYEYYDYYSGINIDATAVGFQGYIFADTMREITLTVTTYMVGTYADGYKAYENDIGSYLFSEGYGVSGMPEPLEGNPSAFLDWFSSVNYEEGKTDGASEVYTPAYNDGYSDGYQDSYKDLYDQLHSGIKDTMDKAEQSIDITANGSFIQGFLAGMWNGVTAFISMILTGVTFSDLSLMNILATALGILIAVYVIKMVKG